jgi:hypothetical protein
MQDPVHRSRDSSYQVKGSLMVLMRSGENLVAAASLEVPEIYSLRI